MASPKFFNFEPDYEYRKAVVFLSTMSPEMVVQPDPFGESHKVKEAKKGALMRMMDDINTRWPGTLFFASEGVKRDWHMRRRFLSPRYTTRWSESPDSSKKRLPPTGCATSLNQANSNKKEQGKPR